MYKILNTQQQSDPALYPEWTNLGWFQNVRGITCDIEEHYHDAPEIWLWHEGGADGIFEGTPVDLHHGVLVYTPAKCLHSYKAHGMHSNTGISPKLDSTMRSGHLHLEETGELLIPEMASFHLPCKQNNPASPVDFPSGAFLKNAYCGEFNTGDTVYDNTCDNWIAILIREGQISGTVDGEELIAREGDLLIVSAGSKVKLHTDADSEIAFAIGWPCSGKE